MGDADASVCAKIFAKQAHVAFANDPFIFMALPRQSMQNYRSIGNEENRKRGVLTYSPIAVMALERATSKPDPAFAPDQR